MENGLHVINCQSYLKCIANLILTIIAFTQHCIRTRFSFLYYGFVSILRFQKVLNIPIFHNYFVNCLTVIVVNHEVFIHVKFSVLQELKKIPSILNCYVHVPFLLMDVQFITWDYANISIAETLKGSNWSNSLTFSVY